MEGLLAMTGFAFACREDNGFAIRQHFDVAVPGKVQKVFPLLVQVSSHRCEWRYVHGLLQYHHCLSECLLVFSCESHKFNESSWLADIAFAPQVNAAIAPASGIVV